MLSAEYEICTSASWWRRKQIIQAAFSQVCDDQLIDYVKVLDGCALKIIEAVTIYDRFRIMAKALDLVPR